MFVCRVTFVYLLAIQMHLVLCSAWDKVVVNLAGFFANLTLKYFIRYLCRLVQLG